MVALVRTLVGRILRLRAQNIVPAPSLTHHAPSTGITRTDKRSAFASLVLELDRREHQACTLALQRMCLGRLDCPRHILET